MTLKVLKHICFRFCFLYVYVCVCSCGSGLSGECLTENGHVWVGLDISPHMLGMAVAMDLFFFFSSLPIQIHARESKGSCKTKSQGFTFGLHKNIQICNDQC